ncbi:hypothetical protein [Paenibacillus sambharensis]|uniref:hypothetical protein n=1 Tax=Paenibacillus sambharensis TaxID=1803190 RepID=UPI0015E8D794|nr:hypothetical protein [Paenibacillus sambharensis]
MGILYDIVNQKKVSQETAVNSKVSKTVVRIGSTPAVKGGGSDLIRRKDILVK